MPPIVASGILAIGIAGLFFLDRREKSHGSSALWIPFTWLFIVMSRSVSHWLGVAPPSDHTDFYLEGSPLDRDVFSALEVLALIVVARRWRRVRPILRRNWVIGLFFFYAACSLSWSNFPLVAFKHWVKAIGDLMMILIVLTEANVAGAIRCLVTRLGFVLLPLSILFIKFYPQLGRRLTNSWTLEPIGVCEQKNGLGILCYTLGLGLIWRFRSAYTDRKDRYRRRRLLAIGTVLAMIVWLLAMCNSLSSICALSMGSIVMLLSGLRFFRRHPALVQVLPLSMFGVAIYALFFQDSGALVSDLGRDPTLSGRTVGWQIMVGLLDNHLIGAGYDSFWLGSRLQKFWDAFPNLRIGQAHNGYIEIFLNLGWIGVILLGVLIVTGYRNVTNAYRCDPDVGGLRIAYLLAVLINALAEGVFRMLTPPWIFLLLVSAIAPWVPQRHVSAMVASGRNPSGAKSDAGFEEGAGDNSMGCTPGQDRVWMAKRQSEPVETRPLRA